MLGANLFFQSNCTLINTERKKMIFHKFSFNTFYFFWFLSCNWSSLKFTPKPSSLNWNALNPGHHLVVPKKTFHQGQISKYCLNCFIMSKHYQQFLLHFCSYFGSQYHLELTLCFLVQCFYLHQSVPSDEPCAHQ